MGGISCQELQFLCNIIDTVKFIKSREKVSSDHIIWTEVERLIKINQDHKPTIRHPPGWPQKQWADSWMTSENIFLLYIETGFSLINEEVDPTGKEKKWNWKNVVEGK